MSEVQKLIREVMDRMNKLDDIQNRPARHYNADMDVWLHKEKKEIDLLLEEAYLQAEPDYPDQQRIFDHEIESEYEIKEAS